VFQSVLELGTGLAGLALVFGHTPRLAGWAPAQLLTVLGVYLLLGGVIQAAITPNTGQLMEMVREGTLDHTLMRPADGQLLVSIGQFQLWKVVDILLGGTVIAVSLVLQGSALTVVGAAAFLLALLAGGVMIYSVWFLLACTAFWFVRVWSVMDLLEGVVMAGRWPLGIYPRWMRVGLTFLVPVGFAVTVPAEVLVRGPQAAGLAASAGLAVGLLTAARGVWRWGLRAYSGASA
jgi:ABC-2 type transport system permease protein